MVQSFFWSHGAFPAQCGKEDSIRELLDRLLEFRKNLQAGFGSVNVSAHMPCFGI